MRIVLTLAVLVLCTSHGVLAGERGAQLPSGASAAGPAPADEYFGRLKMSILGIRNQLVHLAQVQGQEQPPDADSLIATALLTEESIKDWERHFPHDPWLAKTISMLVHVYAKVPGETGHAAALRTLGWLLTSYPQSEFSQAALRDLGEDPSVRE